MITESIREDVKVLWQEWVEENGPEPAILVRVWSDTVEINQEGRTIGIAKHEWSNFLKELKKVQL